jgi:ribonucleoside-triphosphate reductase
MYSEKAENEGGGTTLANAKKKGSVKVFDAVAAPLRLQILRLLYAKGALSYSEIMNQLDLNPSRDAGKFAYHLRTLNKADLVETNEETKKYRPTVLGNMILETSQNLEEHFLREQGRLLVRTSRLAMEEFDRGKIVQALHREAAIPLGLAKKIAEETEERLLKLDTLYLTAPLIREFINAVLIEQGLHEYRHKLTRLGSPVYDVTQLIAKAGTAVEDVSHLMGRNVMVEYVLLNVLPRDVADAHLSGLLHVSDVDTWVLKPCEIQHDLRVSLRDGLTTRGATSMTLGPPKTLEGALVTAASLVSASGTEVSGEQGVNHFNLFLAPYAMDRTRDAVSGALKRFLFSLSQSVRRKEAGVSLTLDLTVPAHLQDTGTVVGLDGRTGGYNDVSDASLMLVDVLFDVLLEHAEHTPIFHPRLIVTLTESSLKDRTVEPLLVKAHQLAAKTGAPYFINQTRYDQSAAAYLSTGSRLSPHWTGDWELDTLRTGKLGSVIINLPRLSYEAKGSERRFYKGLDGCMEKALEALSIKYDAVTNRRDTGRLHMLSSRVRGEPYCRLQNMTFDVSFVGLNEATKAMTGQQLHEAWEAVDFAKITVGHMAAQAKQLSRDHGIRVTVSQSTDDEAAKRLAELDVERHGWSEVVAQGSRESPYYTNLHAVPLHSDVPLDGRLNVEGIFHPLLAGGHLAIIQLEEPEQNVETLLDTTRKVCHTSAIGFYTFTRELSHCVSCGTVYGGLLNKCWKCETTDSLTRYSRLSSHYAPLTSWPRARRQGVDTRVRYALA